MKKHLFFLFIIGLPAFIWSASKDDAQKTSELLAGIRSGLESKDSGANERALKQLNSYMKAHQQEELELLGDSNNRIVAMALDPKDRNQALATEVLFLLIPAYARAGNTKGEEGVFYDLLGHPDPKLRALTESAFFSKLPNRNHEGMLEFYSTDPRQRAAALRACEIYGAASLFSYQYLQDCACNQKGDVQKEALRILAEGNVKVKDCNDKNYYYSKPNKPLDPPSKLDPRWEKWASTLKADFETSNKADERRNKSAEVSQVKLESEKDPCLLLTYTDYEGAGAQTDNFEIYRLNAKGKPVSMLSTWGVVSKVQWAGHSGLFVSFDASEDTVYLCVGHRLKPVFTFEDSDCAWQQGCSFTQKLCEDNGNLAIERKYEEHEEVMRNSEEFLRDARCQRAPLTWDEKKQEFHLGSFEVLESDLCPCSSTSMKVESTPVEK